MERRDVSFTFLHRVEEVELNIEDGRWQSALALALTLPDICGGIAFPEYVKRYRDGRVMLDKQKNPTRDVGTQYVSWFDTYAAPFFKQSPKDEAPYICGTRCWQLRCEYLHQNKGFINEGDETEVHFHLGVNCGTSICQQEKVVTISGNRMDIRIDIEQFCWRMCQAARNYYHQFREEKDFELYNTPVLDFIQLRQGLRVDKMAAVICPDVNYGEALQMALQNVVNRIGLYKTLEDAKNKLKKVKPDVWIVTEGSMRANDEAWYSNQKNLVIILLNRISDIHNKNEDDGIICLKQPVSVDVLRETIQKYLK